MNNVKIGDKWLDITVDTDSRNILIRCAYCRNMTTSPGLELTDNYLRCSTCGADLRTVD